MENEKILYTKYSNDRAASFRISTQIVERNGKKIVCKSAMEESSRTHVLAMKKHESALNEMFSGTKFKANKIVSFGEDFVDFEYLEGTSYDQILDGYLKNKDMDGFYSAVRLFFDELDKLATTEFHATEKSKEIFGENAFDEGENALPVGNIDQIFQNMLVDSDGNWNVIDYEWTFDFAVPVWFLKCRALLIYFFTSSTRFSFYNQELLSKFNLTENNFENCKKIDQTSFTRYVQKNHLQLSDFTRYMRKNIINPYVLENQDYIDVFYDTGNGFSEAEKDTFYQFPVTIFPKENLHSIRIDPSVHHCIVSDISIRAGEKSLSFTTNAYMQKNGDYFFNTSDSQIYVDLHNESAPYITFNMKVFALDETCSAAIAEQNVTIENLRSIADDFRCQLEQRIRQTELAIQAKREELNAIYASRSWKITKPLRFVGKMLRKLKRP